MYCKNCVFDIENKITGLCTGTLYPSWRYSNSSTSRSTTQFSSATNTRLLARAEPYNLARAAHYAEVKMRVADHASHGVASRQGSKVGGRRGLNQDSTFTPLNQTAPGNNGTGNGTRICDEYGDEYDNLSVGFNQECFCYGESTD